MLNYIEYLGLPNTIAIGLVVLFFALQVIGELLEFKGKAVPEILKVRKYFARKKEEREIMKAVPSMVDEMKKQMKDVKKQMKEMGEKFDSFTAHYSKDNIDKRDEWIGKVNQHLDDSCYRFEGLDAKADKNSSNITKLLINTERREIIDFALYVSDSSNPVTREQFNRIFKLYQEYEDTIEENGLTNGEVDISHGIIVEAYEQHMKNHSFIEDIRKH